MTEFPKSIFIIGGGVIGIEWASMLADFGVAVTVLEYAGSHHSNRRQRDLSIEILVY